MAGKPQHDYDRILRQAREVCAQCESAADLGRAVGIRPQLMRRILKARGYETFQDFLVEVVAGDAEDVGILKRQVAHFRRVTQRLEGQLQDRAWLREEVAGQIAALEPVSVPRIEGKGAYSEQVACLLFSDAHFGLNVPQGQLGVFGQYSSAMAEERTIYVFRTFARLAHQQSFPVRKAKVYLLGDNVEHSYMRPSQPKQIDAHVVKQSIECSNVLGHCLRFLAGEFEEVEVEAVPGNHGRTTQKAGENLPDETYDHLIYFVLQHMLRDQENVRITAHDAWYFVDRVLGYKILGMHGEDAISWAGIPWYGIKRLVKDYFLMLTRQSVDDMRELDPEMEMALGTFLEELHTPDFVIIGHFHNPFTWDLMGVEVIANGALSGVSLYSAKRLHKLTPPSQTMFWVHPEHGVGLRLPIDAARVGQGGGGAGGLQESGYPEYGVGFRS